MSKTLLIVDDALIIREMVKDAAREAGWEIVGEATDGQVAIDRYRELKPDVCTLDLVMPEYDGLHALRGIRALDPTAKVVVLSAVDQKNVLKEAIQLGAADFVVKPFDNGILIDTLEKVVLQRASADPQAAR
ncbi:MAG: two-component system response regulator [Planctomycetes bacterium RBG_13_63_9]|nr:MAG: two-component system response regulator [Planctomycetes bacterium RBG_13_63_9]